MIKYIHKKVMLQNQLFFYGRLLRLKLISFLDVMEILPGDEGTSHVNLSRDINMLNLIE